MSKGIEILVALLTNVAKRVTLFFQRKLHLIPQLFYVDILDRMKFLSFIAAFTLVNRKNSAGVRSGEQCGWIISTAPQFSRKSFTIITELIYP
jgi:hypothetical protein